MCTKKYFDCGSILIQIYFFKSDIGVWAYGNLLRTHLYKVYLNQKKIYKLSKKLIATYDFISIRKIIIFINLTTRSNLFTIRSTDPVYWRYAIRKSYLYLLLWLAESDLKFKGPGVKKILVPPGSSYLILVFDRG